MVVALSDAFSGQFGVDADRWFSMKGLFMYMGLAFICLIHPTSTLFSQRIQAGCFFLSKLPVVKCQARQYLVLFPVEICWDLEHLFRSARSAYFVPVTYVQ